MLGARYRSNALAQEKTGEFWVAAKMAGILTRSDFEHCEVGVFIGKNPWFSHGFPRTRVMLREMAKDPNRCMIVIDPRRTETADLADIHLQVRPGGDAWLLAAMFGVIVQEGLLAKDWIEANTDGIDEVLPHFEALPIERYCDEAGVPEAQVREAARRIAAASSAALVEDLGVQMNRHFDAGLLPASPDHVQHGQLRQARLRLSRHLTPAPGSPRAKPSVISAPR